MGLSNLRIKFIKFLPTYQQNKKPPRNQLHQASLMNLNFLMVLIN